MRTCMLLKAVHIKANIKNYKKNMFNQNIWALIKYAINITYHQYSTLSKILNIHSILKTRKTFNVHKCEKLILSLHLEI